MQDHKVEKRFTGEDLSDKLDAVDTVKIRSFHKTLTDAPHIAAGPRDVFLTNWIKSKWEEFGFDKVQLDTYDFLLSFPDQENPNKIYLKDENDVVQFTSKHKEDVLRQEDDHPKFIHAFNAHTPAANVTGELVYVNFGRIEDIQMLEELGVNLTGKIAISRYGKIFRGNRLKNCQNAGAIGVIMYSDPQQVAPDGTDPDSVYPNTFSLPPSGVQRGGTLIDIGDPLSPSWPSVPGAYRPSINQSETEFPKIPSQPIGYGDAKILLEKMAGDLVPEDWKGGLDIQYRLGPGFDDNHQGWKVNLVTHNYMEDKKSDNVIGIIYGSQEPDRYVLFGNHRDAWGYGAIDASSGTAPMMEMARVLGEDLKAGWRPRRSIVFASWASEEAGIMGSTEWVFDKIHKLTNRAVSFTNLDICVSGTILHTSASPSLKTVVHNSLLNVKALDSDKSYLEFLEEYYMKENPPKNINDSVRILGSGSDHAGFAYYAGIPSTFHGFSIDRQKYPKIKSGYPTYHTGFETFYLYENLIDPGFKVAKQCAQISLSIILEMAESPLLPYSFGEIKRKLDESLSYFEEKIFPVLRQYGAGESIKVLKNSMMKFDESMEKFLLEIDRIKNEETLQELKIRMLNDKMMLLERIFLIPSGLPGRPIYRHLLFSPAKFNAYAGSVLPGLRDLTHGFEKLEEDQKLKKVDEAKKHLSDLMIVFRQAANWLDDKII